VKSSFGLSSKIAATLILPAALCSAIVAGAVATGGTARAMGCSNPEICGGPPGSPNPNPDPNAAYLAVDGSLAGGAMVQTCASCSGGEKVGWIGEGGTLTFTNVYVQTTGIYDVNVVYCDGSATGRQFNISTGSPSVSGSETQLVSDTPTGSFVTLGSLTVALDLVAGYNTVEIWNDAAYAPDINEILVPALPSS
jgi:hypothetical protein